MWRLFIILFLAALSWAALADEPAKPDIGKLQAALGGKAPDSVNPTVIPGLFEVVVGSQILYLSADGGFVIQGDVIDLAKRDNLTEIRRNGLRVKAIDSMGENNMVVFAPKEAVKHTINVFTDIDCGYCRKMHQQIADYNQRGIKVRYLMFPRAGVNSDAYNKAVTVWCADDRQDAMTRSKRGEAMPTKSCDNPVKKHMDLGDALGVRGTPSIVLENGEMLPGFVPPDKLAQMLDENHAMATKLPAPQ